MQYNISKEGQVSATDTGRDLETGVETVSYENWDHHFFLHVLNYVVDRYLPDSKSGDYKIDVEERPHETDILSEYFQFENANHIKSKRVDDPNGTHSKRDGKSEKHEMITKRSS